MRNDLYIGNYRHEYKFLVDEMQSAILQSKLKSIMQLDKYVGSLEYYRVRSAYFDNYDDTCLKQNEDGTDPRGKWRIRIYNSSDDRIILEHKIKRGGMTQKKSEIITKEQSNSFLSGMSVKYFDIRENSILYQFNLIMQKQYLRPKVIVDYVRIPFVERLGNVRITFDKCLSSSNCFSRFFEADIPRRTVMPTGKHIMEVKYDEFFPGYLKKVLEIGGISRISYSKYFLCRKYGLKENQG